jgi:hypothetical protein
MTTAATAASTSTLVPRKVPFPRHPRVVCGLRFWVEIIQAGELWEVTAMIEGLDLGVQFDVECTPWGNRERLNVRIDAALTRWATEDRKKINAEIAAKAHEEWQAKQFWMTRGAQGQQKPSHF